MKNCILLLVFFICAKTILSQGNDTLSVFDCYDKAIYSHPLFEQKDLLYKSSELQMRNISTSWYPQLNIHAQATYQSDVTKIELALPMEGIDIPSAPYDQYKAVLEIQQTLYDGGIIKQQKQFKQLDHDRQQQQLEVELYKIKSQVNNVYFNVLLLQKNAELITRAISELKIREKNVISGVKNGLLLQSDHDMLRVEILKAEQRICEIKTKHKAALTILGKLTNQELHDSIILVLPFLLFDTIKPPTRPEKELFVIQLSLLDESKDILNGKRNPKVFAFSQAGYGRPGLNMLSNEFEPYYIIGLGLKWNIWDWGYVKREKDVLEVRKSIVKSNEKAFDKQLILSLENEATKIKYIKATIKKDMEIIELRKSIVHTASSQLDNGVISTAEYIDILNEELFAQIEYLRHTILLEQAKADYLLLKGEL